MNINTNHLVEAVIGLDDYEPVPENLNRAAKRKLNGRKEAVVSMISGGKLSKWARRRRKEIKAEAWKS